MTQWPVSSGYDPEKSQVGIVHIGPGAFHRAHQAVYTDDALARFGGDWRILGVSLRSASTAQKLNAQDGLYTLVVRPDKPDMPSEYRVIGSVAGVLAPDAGFAHVLLALASPETRIVSLTITEKAYGVSAAKSALDMNDPQIVADLANSKAPTGAIGLVTRALQMRYEAGLAPFSVMSCDNLPDNGLLVRSGVLDFAQRIDPILADWIRRNVSFPSTMVDRITPATTQALCDEVHRETGHPDTIPVETETFSQWVVEDNFCNGRPPWDDVGVLMVKDVGPYEQMKLRMLNGAHSMLAYAGFLAGHKYVRDVMADPALSRLVACHINAAGATLDPLHGVNFKEYAQTLVLRFSNPNIAHETYQIAMDGSQKMPQRIFEPALVALDRGTNVDPFAFSIACWIQYLSGAHDTGESYELRDPRESELSNACAAGGNDTNAIVAEIFALPDLLPLSLAENPGFQTLVHKHLHVMRLSGVNVAIAKAVTENE
ncbi:MAG: fructuronate reductase [bacterium]